MIENFYDNCDLLYSVHFNEINYYVFISDVLLESEKVNYELVFVLIVLLDSYKISENHISIELGTILKVNGKFKSD